VRILIVSDVHANWEALRAVLQEPHDHLIFLGDAVDFGPEPQLCVKELRTSITWAVRGNHDHGAAFDTDCRSFGPWHAWDEATRPHTRRMLSAEDRRFLQALPLRLNVPVGGITFNLVHAAPSEPLYLYLPPDAPDSVLAREVALAEADALLFGHTHLQMLRRIEDCDVVNPGSVGMPREGDGMARYAIWEDGRFQLRHCAYDVETTVRRLEALKLPGAVTSAIVAVLRGKPTMAAPSSEPATG